jgi:hypothetical protein
VGLSWGILPWLSGVLLTGEAVARLLRLAAGDPGERLARNFGLGIITGSLSLFWLSLVGAPLVLPTLLLVTAFWCLLGWRLGRRPKANPLPALEPLARGLLGFAGLLGLIILAASLEGPESSLDGRSHWGMCARMLWYDRGVWGGTFWDPDRLFPHRRYPLLVPLEEWSVFAYCGRCDPRSVMALFGLVWWAQVGLLWGELRRTQKPLLAAALVLLWASLPFPAYTRDGGAVSGYSDLLLTVLVTGGAIAVMRRNTLEFAIWCAGMLFTKREGLPLCGLSLLLLLASRERKLWWRSAIVSACLTAPWFAFVNSLPYDRVGGKTVAGGVGAQAVTLPLTWPSLANWGPRNFARIASQLWFEPKIWGLLWWVLLLAVLSPKRWKRASWVPFLFMLSYAPVLLMVFLPLSPDHYDWNTVNRTFMPLTGVAVCFIASRFSSALTPEADQGLK